MADLILRARLDGDSGKLVGQLSAAEAAARGLEAELDQSALAARKLDNAVDALANQQAIATRATQAAKEALAAGTITQAQYNRMLIASKADVAQYAQQLRALQKTQADNLQSVGAQRAGYQQLGFQMQDVFQQVALGINPLVILAQQGGQTASAIALMGERADGTQSRFVKFATFLSGPWGAAIFGATTIVGFLVQGLLDTEDATQTAEFASSSFSDAQSILAKVINLTTGELNKQTAATVALARAQAKAGEVKARKEQAEARSEMGEVTSYRPLISGGFGGGLSIKMDRARTGDIVEAFREGSLDITEAERGLRSLLDTGLATEEQWLAASQAVTKYASAVEDEQSFKDVQAALAGDRGALAQFLTPAPARKPPRPKVDRSAEKAAREAQRLLEFGEKASERIERINEQFGEQPRLVTEVNQTVRELDGIIADLEKRKPIGWQKMAADAREAQQAARDSLVKPFEDLLATRERERDLQSLIAAGREDEAVALRSINQLVDKVGFATRDQREAILANAEAERRWSEEVERRQNIYSMYRRELDGLRGDLEGFLSGNLSAGGVLKNVQQGFRQLQAQSLTEKIFGPALKNLDEYLREKTNIKSSVDIFKEGAEDAGKAGNGMADSLERASMRVDRLFTKDGALAVSFEEAFKPYAALPAAPGDAAAEPQGNEIVVTGHRVIDMSPEAFFKKIGVEIGVSLADELNSVFDTTFFDNLTGGIAGAFQGYARGGSVGGVLGGLQGLVNQHGAGLFGGVNAESISRYLGAGVNGAQTGQFVAGLGKMLGLKTSTTGGQIGGAIGSVLPIPGGQIIGSIAGSFLGGLFKSNKKDFGTVTLSDIAGLGAITSRGKEGSGVASGLGGSVLDGLQRIADQFGAQVGAFDTMIGVYDGKYRVRDTAGGWNGQGGLNFKGSSARGLKDFGQDERGAVAYAIMDAIGDGAVKGISAAVQKALGSSPDLDKAIKEALAVKEVEDLLAGMDEAWRAELRAFERTAGERLRIGREYGFDLVELERRNAEERKALMDSILQDQVGSLKDLLSDLAFGDLAEGTLAERRRRLQREIAKAEKDVEAGNAGAADRLASLSRQLIGLSRDAYGTAGGEYGADRAQTISTAERVVALQEERLRAAQAELTTRLDEGNSLASRGNVLTNETNNLLAGIQAGIERLGVAPSGNGFAQGLPTGREIVTSYQVFR